MLDDPGTPAEPAPAAEPGAWIAHIREIHPFWAARGLDADEARDRQIERDYLAKQWKDEPDESC